MHEFYCMYTQRIHMYYTIHTVHLYAAQRHWRRLHLGSGTVKMFPPFFPQPGTCSNTDQMAIRP